MAYSSNATRPNIDCPAGVTQDQANTIRDAKVAFFSNVFTSDQILNNSKHVYSIIVNSKDAQGATLEQLVGTINTKALMNEITFKLLTGHYHT